MNVRVLHRLFRVFSTTFLLLLLTCSLTIQAALQSDEASRAQRVITQMRRAVFGEIKLESIKGLSLSWSTRHQRLNGDQDTGEVICDLLLPNKMLTKNTRVFSGNQGQVIIYRLLNGGRSWSDISSSSSNIPIMRIDAGVGDDDQAKQLQAIRREQAFQLLRLMLPSSPDFPLTFAYAGEAKANDGEADIIDVRGPDDFSARLLIDKVTSHLLMMTYQDQASFRIKFDSRDASKGNVTLPSGVSQKRAEVKARFSDYRPESGVMLPHLITYENSGRIITEYELKGFKLNPSFAPDHFEPGKKRK